MMWWLLIPLGVLVLLFIFDLVLLSRNVRHELRRRRLIRDDANDVAVLVNPASGWRVAETGTFTRDGDHFEVIVMARGWFRHELAVRVELVYHPHRSQGDEG